MTNIRTVHFARRRDDSTAPRANEKIQDPDHPARAMIIRRISNSLRRQDWTTVFVELLMVVIGIFLGIEAANWNEDRRDRLEESAYLLRLHEDVRDTISALRQGQSDVIRWNEQGQKALRALQENDRSLMAGEGGFAIAASTRIGLPATQLATITELISSGRLNEISDPDIRAQLASMDGNISSLDEHIQILVDYAAPVASMLQMHLRPAFTDSSQWTSGAWDKELTYDFETLAADEKFQNTLGFALRLQRWNIVWMEIMISHLEEFEITLARSLGIEASSQVAEAP